MTAPVSDSPCSGRPAWVRLQSGMLVVVLLAFASPLAAHAVLGTTMRYSGDDYCYAGLYHQRGLSGLVWTTYTEDAPFNGNRFSLTVASGIADAIGPLASAWLPGIMLALWAVGLAMAFNEIRLWVGLPLKPLEILVGAVVLIFAVTEALPDPIQTLYWRSAMFPYLTPLVLLSFFVGLVISGTRRHYAPIGMQAAVFVLALFAAGFSETAAAMQLAVLASLGFVGWRLTTVDGGPSQSSPRLLVAAAAGTLVATALLIWAPGERAAMRGVWQEFDLQTSLGIVLENLYLFGYAFFLRKTLTLGIVFLLWLWLSFGMFRSRPIWWKPEWRVTIRIALTIPGVALAIGIASLIPSSIALAGYPPGRVLTGITLVGIAGVAAEGAVAGFVAARLLPTGSRRPLARLTMIVVVASIFPISLSGARLAELGTYQRWASFWDQRHAQILAARRQGLQSMDVVRIDHIIPDVAELQPDPDYWYNNCAEWYYDLSSLSANQPGWND